MASSAKSAFGTKLYRGGSGTPKTSGQLVEEVASIEPADKTDEDVDVTSHDSVATEDINSGCPDEGEVIVEGVYVAGTGQELLRGDVAGAKQGYYVNLAGGSGQKQLDFNATVKSFSLQTGLRDAIRFRARIKITEAVTWTNQS